MMCEGEGEGGSTASSSAVAALAAATAIAEGGGRRKPSWRERENNRRRERRRRAIGAKIYAGLRAQGNYNLPKHCDNNEVLKALCIEAGWIVEPDGQTYRKGCRPIPMETGGISANNTPSSSRHPSPPSSYFATPVQSYQASPLSSTCPSPSRLNASKPSNSFAFLQSCPLPPNLPYLRISNSAPVTPPLSSPTRFPPKPVFTLDSLARESMFGLNFNFNNAASLPSSPTRGHRFRPVPIPECDESETSTNESAQWGNFRDYNMVPHSPTFNLTKPVALRPTGGNAVLDKGKGVDFNYGKLPVKAWAGERIHEMRVDDLDLTLGSSSSRV